MLVYAPLRGLRRPAIGAGKYFSPQMQAFASTVRNRRSASLASSLAALVAHWAHFGLFRSSIRNSRLATLPLASLLCSLDFRFACFAHCASLRVLATSALRAFDGQRAGRECIFTHSSQSSIHIARKACLWLLLLTGLTSACVRHRRRPPCASSIRNGRPAAPDGLQFSFAHWAYFGLFPPQAAASVRPAKNARNDVHAVISDLSLVLPILCQCSGPGTMRAGLAFA